MKPPKLQQGVAAVVMMIVLPVLMGFMLFTLEASYLLRARAALGDAAETAILAVAASRATQPEQQKTIAFNWLEAANIPINAGQSWLNSVELSTNHCDDAILCAGTLFEEYQLRVNGFPGQLVSGQDQRDTPETAINNQLITHGATARRYMASKAKDVYFVTDFSSSMNQFWQGHAKIDMLRRLIIDMANMLEQETVLKPKGEGKNTIALIPFSGSTFQFIGKNRTCPIIQVPISATDDRPVDMHRALAEIWQPKSCYDGVIRQCPSCTPTPNFYTVPSTTSAAEIQLEIERAEPVGLTASYEGIIRAAQLAHSGKNAEQIIIVLSDGKDSFTNLHRKMVRQGYCDNIRAVLNRKLTPSGEPIKSSIAVLAYDYYLAPDNPIARCADPDKIYTAEDIEDLKHKVISIIKDNTIRLYRPPQY